ncbi:putative peptidoglycan-binding peptidase [Escherichia coli]|uniref:Putative peptidoglycan-binding peptidase n=1 Tax=Escherichia coli TaxID=562 RepID=A0A376VHZ3_ECOLX|nr:putative peptidoglycan-binding peptidase [Escherichia coli]
MFITAMPRQLSKPLSWNRTKFVRSYLKPVSRLIKLHKKMKAIPQDELDDKIAGEAGVHEYVVSTGDTLSSILNQYGIDMGDITPTGCCRQRIA